jgi:hypothetical protein
MCSVLPCVSYCTGSQRCKDSQQISPITDPKTFFKLRNLLISMSSSPETRAGIWYFAVQSPQVVEVHETDLIVFIANRPTPLRSKPRPKTHHVVHFRSKTSDPPLLSTCHELRQIALTNIGLKEDRPCE